MSLARTLAIDLAEDHPDDAAAMLEVLPVDESTAFVDALPVEAAARVLRRTTAHPAAAVLSRLPAARAAEIATRLPTEVAAGYLRRVTARERTPILEALDERRSRSLEALLRFREGTAGALMDPEVLALPGDLEVRTAIERVRQSAEHARYNVYVVDRDDRLQGVFNLRELLLADPRQTLAGVMQRDVIHVHAETDWRTLVDHPGWRRVHSLPVVDDAGTYLGAVRYRTLRDLEAQRRSTRRAEPGVTAQALGDLISVGLSGAMEAIAAASRGGSPPRRPSDGE